MWFEGWPSTSKHAALFRVSDSVFLLPCAAALVLSWCHKSEHLNKEFELHVNQVNRKQWRRHFQHLVNKSKKKKRKKNPNDFVFQFVPVIKPCQLLHTDWKEMSMEVDYWARLACLKLDHKKTLLYTTLIWPLNVLFLTFCRQALQSTLAESRHPTNIWQKHLFNIFCAHWVGP